MKYILYIFKPRYLYAVPPPKKTVLNVFWQIKLNYYYVLRDVAAYTPERHGVHIV